MAFATDHGNGLAIHVIATNRGPILYPLANASGQTSLSLAGNSFEYVTLQYDAGGNFRVEQVTPATAQQLGLAGTGGLSRWRFPAVSAYNAGLADNGTAVSAFNSPLGYLTVTLPPATTINTGWTLAIANDNGKLAAVQVNATNGGKILYPGSGATVTSVQLAAGDYEMAVLQFDGSNFRVLHLTPASAAALAIPGTSAISRWSFPAVNAY